MIFTNARTIDKTKTIPSPAYKNPGMTMTLTSSRRPTGGQHAMQQLHNMMANAPMRQESSSERPDGRKKWGPHIWYFFHTVAEKVQDEHFPTVRCDLLKYIEIICKNLPCPSCAAHASDYISRVNIHSIQTKEDLKKLLYVFHNNVSKRIGHSEFLYSELTDKYSNAHTVNIYNNFIIAFSDKHNGIRLISDDMYRARLCKQITAWFSDNIKYFDK